MTPSTQAGWVGSLWAHMEALLLHREMASLWNRWQVDSSPVRCPRRRPILQMLWTASSLQPPRDSTTSGMNSTPTDRHASLWAAIFCSSPTLRACPWVLAAPARVRDCRVEIAVTSRAAGRPLHQLGRKYQQVDCWFPGSVMALFSSRRGRQIMQLRRGCP